MIQTVWQTKTKVNQTIKLHQLFTSYRTIINYDSTNSNKSHKGKLSIDHQLTLNSPNISISDLFNIQPTDISRMNKGLTTTKQYSSNSISSTQNESIMKF